MTGTAGWLPPAIRRAPEGPPEPGDARPGAALLDALLRAVEDQTAVLAQDIDRLWDDLFVDSCADDALPGIAALVGLPRDAGRLEIASAVALARRKGTPAALEDFAEVVTGLTARVLEGWQVTLWMQRLGHPAPPRLASVDLRDRSRHRIGTPFDRVRHAVTPGGPYAPRTVTAVVWPWQVRTLTDTEALSLGSRRFALHPAGTEAPLYLRPRPLRLASEATATGSRTGDESDAPVRAGYRVLESLAGPGDITYGASLRLSTDHPLAERPPALPPLLRLRTRQGPVPWDALRFGSIPDGTTPAPPAAGEVLVDVARGRVQLGTGLTAPVLATWHRPLAGAIGTFAATERPDPLARAVVRVDPDSADPADVTTLAAAFARARALAAALDPAGSRPDRPDVEIRLNTSRRLAAPPPQAFAPGAPRWRIVAPGPLTPTVDGALELDLVGGEVELAGFLLTGDLVLGPTLRRLDAIALTVDPRAGRLLVDPGAWELAVTATRCVLGPIRADLAALPLVLRDCVVDGLGRSARVCGGAPGGTPVDAVAASGRFGPVLQADSVTFAGAVRADAVDAQDCLFDGGLSVVQRQEGCLRYCHLGPELESPPSHPATYRCGPFPPPAFVSQGFDAAGYYCLELEPDHPLLSAASDGGEVGAYHRTGRGARIRRLRRRVEEYVPLGLSSQVVVAGWEER